MSKKKKSFRDWWLRYSQNLDVYTKWASIEIARKAWQAGRQSKQ